MMTAGRLSKRLVFYYLHLINIEKNKHEASVIHFYNYYNQRVQEFFFLNGQKFYRYSDVSKFGSSTKIRYVKVDLHYHVEDLKI